MRSSKNITRRPYMPGALRLSDLKPGLIPPAKDMGLMKKSRKFVSDFIQARLHSGFKITAVQPCVSNNEGTRWRAPPLRGPLMRYSNFKGKKRKRESDDGCFFRRKNRLLGGGALKAVTEEEMDRDDLRCRTLLQILYPELEALGVDITYWPNLASEELDDWQDSFGDPTSDLSCTLDNLTIVEDDDTIMHTPCTSSEGYNDSEISWMESISEWGDTHLSRRRHSESSIEAPLYLDVVMDDLSTDSGWRSVPPQLDLTPSLTSQTIGCVSPNHVTVDSEDAFLKELFEPWLESHLEAAWESEYGVETRCEAEDVNTNASVGAEASWETETETGAGVEREVEAEAEAEAGTATETETETEAGAETETEFEPSAETELGETATASTVDEASASERSDEEIEEMEMEEADVSASGEGTGTNLAPEGTESETETETADYRTEVEEAEENTGAKEAGDIAGVEAPEAIDEDAVMQGFEETTPEPVETDMAAGKIEPSTPTSATVSEPRPEFTSPIPESAVPTRESALRLTFRTVNLLANQIGSIADYDYGTETCARCQQIDVDVARRIRAVRERVLEELMVIERSLGPYCCGG